MRSFCPRCTVGFDVHAGSCPFCDVTLRRSDPDQLLGVELNRKYFLIEVIGQGGMGTVFLARQRSTNQDVAIKVLRPARMSQEKAVARFHREGRAASQLQHPNIVRTIELDETEEGLLYIAMEHLPGRLLSELISPQQPMSLERAVAISAQICDALAEAHGCGVVHRDLKPTNLMLLAAGDGDEQVKVLDFGLAKVFAQADDEPLTTHGDFFGTATYMSPEQIQSEPVDNRTDLYALGIVLFEMLSGRPPFKGDSVLATLKLHLASPVPALTTANPNVQLPQDVDRFFRRILAKAPTARFSDVLACKRELLRLGQTATTVLVERTHTDLHGHAAAAERTNTEIHSHATVVDDERTDFDRTPRAAPGEADDDVFATSPDRTAPDRPQPQPRPERHRDRDSLELEATERFQAPDGELTKK